MILVGATMTGFATGRPETCLSWLDTAEQLAASHPAGVRFFAALEVDGRGLAPFSAVVCRLAEANAAAGAAPGEPTHWTFTLDDGRTEVTSANRLGHICAGRNLLADYACAVGASHLLYLDADMCPPSDAIPKLLEVDWPLVGGEVPTYCLSGPPVPGYDFPVQAHMNTAGFLLAERPVFRRIRWRWDPDTGDTDDPCYHRDARDFLGVDTYVRKDVVGRHFPEHVPALEARGYDRSVHPTAAAA